MSGNRDLIALLGTRFVQRRDIKAIQRENGEWNPDRTPFKLQDFEDHLVGKKTLGHYMLDQEGMCKLFAFDIDFVKHGQKCPGTGCSGCFVTFPNLVGEGTFVLNPRQEWLDKNSLDEVKATLILNMRCMAEGLAYLIDRKLGIPVAILNSGGKGLHVYGFTGTISAEVAKTMALTILEALGLIATRGQNFFRHENHYEVLEIEVFPKQTSLEGKDLGNLMALPLGINRKTKNPRYFIHCKSGLNTLPEMDPTLALSGQQPWE